MDKKILITGASGLIGTEIIKSLPTGYTWVALSTNKNKCDGKNWFYWNPSAGEIDTQSLKNVEYIIHLAGSSIAQAWTPKNKKEIVDSRVLSTQLLYNFLKNNPHSVKKFISASGIGIYPQNDGTIKNENSLPGNDFPAQVCIQWEAEALKMKTLNIQVHLVRTGIVLSNRGGALVPIKTPVQYFVGAALGTGNQFLSWIHIADIVKVYLHLIESDQFPEIINAVSPQAVSNQEFTNAVARVLKKPLLLPNIPSFVLKLALGPRALLVLEGAHVQPQVLQDHHFNYKFPKLHTALVDLLG